MTHGFKCSLATCCFSFQKQVGVQTLVEPDSGANVLEERVNAVLPLKGKDDDDDDDYDD
jgi:hypothetical protein